MAEYIKVPAGVYDMVTRCMEQEFPDHVAIRYVAEDGKTVVEKKYREYAQDIRRMTAYLKAEVPDIKGRRIVLLSRNCYEFCVASFGIILAGGVLVTLNQKKTWEELEYELGLVEPALILNDGIDYGCRAELEAAGKLTAVITQNIDGLHQAAGSKNVLELHGSIHRNYCMRCKKQYSARFVKESKGIPTCDCGGTIRPDVVLYEEGLDNQIIQKSIRAISEADMLIIGGTSLVVYPAAGFIDYFHGKYLVLINKDATARDVGATLTIHEPIGEVLDRIHV